MLTFEPKLRRVLRINALSCISFGTVFSALPLKVSQFLNPEVDFTRLLFWIGLLLFANGIHLVVASFRAKLIAGEVNYFVLGDALWVLATVTIVSLTDWISSPTGQTAVILIASFIGTLGYFQRTYSKKG